MCEDSAEDSACIFSMCNKSVLCWQRIDLWNYLMVVFDPGVSFPMNVFAILQHLDQHQKQVFGVALWSIWKHMNNKVWNNVIESAQSICERANSLIAS